MNDLLIGLNEKQREAVLQTEGPVMAIAGAGSGKTSVLTKRIAYLIFEKNVNPQNILAITFTNKAANEMKQRVRQALGINTYDMWISTFHSMGARILRDYIERLGYKRNFQIIDDDDTHQLVKNLMKKSNIDTKLFNPKIIRNLVLKMKFDEDFIKSIEAPINEVVAIIYKKYQSYLFESNLVDFEDLLLLTIKLLKQEQDVKAYFNNKFHYVLVDEFQDTNNVQYELIKLLVNENKNIFIVGDEDQSIYAFRGANIENINKFKRDYKNYYLVLLEQNYRSTNNILNAANNIIQNNSTRIPKNLFSEKGKGEPITHYKGVTARDEVEYVAMKIIHMVRKGYEYNDFAILYRANSTSRSFEDVFLQKQIPYRIFGNTSFFKRKEIKDFTAYLRFILNNDDAFSFIRAVSAPRRGIGPVTIERVVDYAANNGLAFSDALRLSSDFLGKTASNKITAFMDMMVDFRTQLDDIPFTDFVDYVLDKTGYIDMLKLDDKGDVRYENLLEFKTILAENNEIYEDLTKEEMLTYILEDIALKSEETKEDVENGVTLMTLHSAKGLEFRVVFIVALEMGMFPLSRTFGDRFEFEEERRLMYVGVTRAKEKLFVTNADTRQTYGETLRNADSVFIEEIPAELLHREGYSVAVNRSKNVNSVYQRPEYKRQIDQKRKSLLSKDNTNDLNKGDKVIHKVFGDGVVVSVAGDHCVIAFQVPHGIKTLLKDHPAISKKK
ncbi:ATP-dependent helicase [Candidatus Xianfuyuplasma coldseepsis]|uniref:DNA 3'-5' helicase n=1 Tax=Candidatus Xianfuyuplasma coldseepsis TaxID=2782163 RepID=A0A7L7KQ90_9MOLU|nr:UvrD-helicase domain-containing protein [Xianfuyuplasma coldseepsis]QMS84883.1 UvrD-helicase domain-containing protein [Xianfuyuplasma coldseepsis]